MINRILAADIGGTKTKMALCTRNGEIKEFQEYETNASLGGEHVVCTLIAYLSTYSNFDAIAISTAGQVNAEEGSIIYANKNIPNYTGMQLKKRLEEHFHVPVKVENDVNAAALGEAHYGAGINHQHFICLTFGTGIGGAIVINQQIYRGASGSAGEFGHMFLHSIQGLTDDPRKFCYEAHASTSALVQLAYQKDVNYSDGHRIIAALEQKEPEIIDLIDQWTTEVASGIASLIHIFNPSLIIIGGGIMEQEVIVQMVEQKVRTLVMSSFNGVLIVRAALGNKAGLLGAISLFATS